MTLSPEDVIKKSFSATHLRRGYDETQVDDFLDEVVVELRRLHAENDSLRTDLADCRASRGTAGDDTDEGSQRTLVGGPRGEDDAEDAQRPAELTAEVEELRAQLATCQEGRAELESRLQAVQEQLAAAQRSEGAGGQDQQGLATLAGAGAEEPSSIIALAQRLHDQHVAEGESARAQMMSEGEEYRDRVTAEAQERSSELTRTGQETHDRLISEGRTQHEELVQTGQETHDRLVSEGRTQHEELVQTGQETHDRLVSAGESRSQEMISQAEQQRTAILEDLAKQQSRLQGRIQELRTQESDLRDRLRAFLTDQLAKVEGDRA